MTLEQIKQFIAKNITYKSDWEFHVKQKNDVMFLQIQFVAPDNVTGVPERQYCRKWQLTEWMTKTELVRTVFTAVLQAEQHEIEELFKYRGRAIHNPHIDADALFEVAERHDCRAEMPTLVAKS